MLTRLARWLSVVVLALAATAAGAAEPRVAVVVGNSAYDNRPLLNPRNDARQVASSLRELGFSTVLLEDASRDDLRRVPDAIKGSFPRGSVGLFYYAGHALQHRGLNYLLPVDFQLSSSDELPREATLVDDILEAMHAAGVKLALVVLDACRDNPFGRPEEALGPGLAAIERAPGETLIAYATSAGAVASDGLSGNSPFTAALVTALERPGLDVYDVFRMVRGFVREATEGQQIPWVSGSIESNFVFREARVVPAVATGEVGVPTMYWASIESSIDPGDFRRFMTAYPQHPLASEARTREQTLVAQGSPTTPLPDFASIVPEAGPTEVTPCDVAASKPGDMRRVAEGVPSGLVNTRLALRVCAEALADDPANPRLLFQLGRVLDIAGRLDEARKLYEQAAEQEYPAAMGNLAYAYWVGRGLTPDLGKTAELTRRAADLGLLGARNLLGTLYIRGNGVPEFGRDRVPLGAARRRRWLDERPRPAGQSVPARAGDREGRRQGLRDLSQGGPARLQQRHEQHRPHAARGRGCHEGRPGVAGMVREGDRCRERLCAPATGRDVPQGLGREEGPGHCTALLPAGSRARLRRGLCRRGGHVRGGRRGAEGFGRGLLPVPAGARGGTAPGAALLPASGGSRVSAGWSRG